MPVLTQPHFIAEFYDCRSALTLNGLPCQREVEGQAVGGVGGGEGGVADQRGVDLVLEEHAELNALRQGVFGRDVDVEVARARGGLRVVRLDAANQGLRLRQLEGGVDVEVARRGVLLAGELDDLEEVGNLIAGVDGDAALGALDELTGRRVERQRAFFGPFGAEAQVVAHGYFQAHQRRETLLNRYGRDVVGR